jgi:hypothetical protein
MPVLATLRSALPGILLVLSLGTSLPSSAQIAPELIITVRAPESDADTRYYYDTEALRLALELTQAKYGPFRIVQTPPMTFSRAIASVSADEYPNFFIKLSYEDRYAELHMRYVRFPVDLGIVGYRVCFTRPDLKAELAKVTRLDELRRYTHGQGHDWADVQILRSNGFTVVEASNYEVLFDMLAKRRFDLFCRGTNELLDEFRSHETLKDFSYDQSFSLAYPLPRFFFTHEKNSAAANRIQEGLLMAFKEGRLQKLWQANYQKSIDFVRLDKRKIFWINNPLLDKVDFNYRQYFYDPLKPSGAKASRK